MKMKLVGDTKFNKAGRNPKSTQDAKSDPSIGEQVIIGLAQLKGSKVLQRRSNASAQPKTNAPLTPKGSGSTPKKQRTKHPKHTPNAKRPLPRGPKMPAKQPPTTPVSSTMHDPEQALEPTEARSLGQSHTPVTKSPLKRAVTLQSIRPKPSFERFASQQTIDTQPASGKKPGQEKRGKHKVSDALLERRIHAQVDQERALTRKLKKCSVEEIVTHLERSTEVLLHAKSSGTRISLVAKHHYQEDGVNLSSPVPLSFRKNDEYIKKLHHIMIKSLTQRLLFDRKDDSFEAREAIAQAYLAVDNWGKFFYWCRRAEQFNKPHLMAMVSPGQQAFDSAFAELDKGNQRSFHRYLLNAYVMGHPETAMLLALFSATKHDGYKYDRAVVWRYLQQAMSSNYDYLREQFYDHLIHEFEPILQHATVLLEIKRLLDSGQGKSSLTMFAEPCKEELQLRQILNTLTSPSFRVDQTSELCERVKDLLNCPALLKVSSLDDCRAAFAPQEEEASDTIALASSNLGNESMRL